MVEILPCGEGNDLSSLEKLFFLNLDSQVSNTFRGLTKLPYSLSSLSTQQCFSRKFTYSDVRQ